MTPRVVLQPRRARPFFGRHPWVFPGAIQRIEGNPADGDAVELVTHEGNFVARGLYNSQSKIRVRLYCWEPGEELDAAFFSRRIAAAIRLRHGILGLDDPHGACRLIFSEADGLSGLTVDRYARWLTVQFTSLALARRQELLLNLLSEHLQPEGIYLRTERGVRVLEGLELHDGPARGTLPAEPLVIVEHGLKFLVNLAEGQKTGLYLDQRENRREVAKLARGRQVLDAFCYTGGFGIHAAKAGAARVLGVDVSEPALTLARQTANLNGLENLEFVRDDVFQRMDALIAGGEQFGLVVLDPPKFARDRQAIPEALKAYSRLQSRAVRLLEADGIFVTCCCSGLITLDMLLALLGPLAAESRREIQLLQIRGPAPDHPTSAACLETGYLKCLICRVA